MSPERRPSESDGTLRSSSRASGLGAMQNVLYESTKGSHLLLLSQLLMKPPFSAFVFGLRECRTDVMKTP
jgi:hypothetical protein